MKDESRIVALWLLPAAPAREHFESLVAELAQEFDAPLFEPHLTLYVTGFDDELRFDALSTMALPSSVDLVVEDVRFSDKFTKTFFVQFKPDAELTELSVAIARALEHDNAYELDPHLSLLYKALPNEKKVELARLMTLPGDRVCFDAMKAIVSSAKVESRAEVEAWRTIWSRKL